MQQQTLLLMLRRSAYILKGIASVIDVATAVDMAVVVVWSRCL